MKRPTPAECIHDLLATVKTFRRVAGVPDEVGVSLVPKSAFCPRQT